MRGMSRGHVKCVPKWRITLMFAQVKAVAVTVCKIADDSFPRFESWTCHQKPQVKPGARTGPGDVGGAVQDTAGAACADAKAALPPAARHPVTSQDARTPRQACRCQEGGNSRRSGSCAKYVPKNSPG
jgi:hypothetical protein